MRFLRFRPAAALLQALLALGFLSLTPGYLLRVPSPEAATRYLEGEHAITYDIINPLGVQSLPTYSIDGFSQKVIAQDEYSKRIVVSANLAPFSSLTPFPVASEALGKVDPSYLLPEKARQSRDPAIVALARSIAAGGEREAEVVEKVLNWICDNLSYDYSLQLPSDALSALHQRKAACVGYTNLAIALLRSLGIPARGAHGYLPPGYEWGVTKEYWGTKINGGGFHVWMEVFYQDVGWVFHDPANSIHFVDPYHILLWIEGEKAKSNREEKGFIDVDRATTFTIFRELSRVEAVDEVSVPSKEILARRWIGRPMKASLSGIVRDQAGKSIEGGKVILWKGERGRIYPIGSGGTFFIPGLDQGNYLISLRAKGFSETQWSGDLKEGERRDLEIALEAGGEVGGKVTDGQGRPISGGKVFCWVGEKGFGVPLRIDGTYLLEGLKPGKYRVSVRAENFPEKFQEAHVTPGSAVKLDFVLSP